MTENFAVLRPVAINDARLTASNVAEPDLTGPVPDPAIWNAATNYAVGTKVTRTGTHKIYERIGAGGVDATPPETDAALDTPTKWVELYATNRWRQFDNANDSITSADDEITGELTPAALGDCLAFINVDAAAIHVVVADSDYDQTIQLATRDVEDWADYFFEPFELKTDVVFEDLPLRLANVITYTISNPGGVATVGAVVLGHSKLIGGVKPGATAGILDFSIKETDPDTLVTTFVERPYSSTLNLEIWVKAAKVDGVGRFLKAYRAQPVVWFVTGNLYSLLVLNGKFNDFQMVIAYPTYSMCSLELESLT